ncbi:MAG: hypothetical protein JO131_06775, partial [Gammaproteobacteria bacterium]|nr:hypothetical protein [Gammaproteobacteria bacterium]
MSNVRGITIGIGYNTLEGAPKADGAIKEIESAHESELNIFPNRIKRQELKHDNTSKEYELLKTPSSFSIPTKQTHYTMSLVKNYKELSQELEFYTGLAGGFYNVESSLEGKFLNKIKLTDEKLALLIKSQTVTDIEHISKNAKLITSARKILKNNLSNFVEAYGDSYVTDIPRGKILYAAIIYKNTSLSELNEIKAVFEGNLSALGINKTSGIEAKLNIEKKLNEIKKSSIIDIQLEFSGVNIDAPAIGTDVNKLLQFIEEYNNQKNLQPGVIIGFYTKPFVTACTSFYPEIIQEEGKLSNNEKNEYSTDETSLAMEKAILLQTRTKHARSLLKKCDDCYKNLKFIIPTMEKITQYIKNSIFENESDKT